MVDADIYGPSQPTLLGTTEKPTRRQDKLVPVEAQGVKLLSMGQLVAAGQALAWRGPMASGALNQLIEGDWGDTELILVDLPPGTGDVQLSLVQKSRRRRGNRLDAAGPGADRRDARASTCSARPACRSSASSRTWPATNARIAARTSRPVRPGRRRSRRPRSWASPSSAACRLSVEPARGLRRGHAARRRRWPAGRRLRRNRPRSCWPSWRKCRLKHCPGAGGNGQCRLDRDEDIGELLANARTIAMVGASDRPDRPSTA